MEQKPIFVMLAAVAALVFVGATTGGHSVNAYEETCHYWSSGYSHCEPGPFFAYTQHPTIHQVSEGWYPCHWRGDGFACLNNGYVQQPHIQQVKIHCPQDGYPKCGFGYTQPGQPQIEPVAFTVKPVGVHIPDEVLLTN
jgi:hypothetical protein